jgi:hypothetical protein
MRRPPISSSTDLSLIQPDAGSASAPHLQLCLPSKSDLSVILASDRVVCNKFPGSNAPDVVIRLRTSSKTSKTP